MTRSLGAASLVLLLAAGVTYLTIPRNADGHGLVVEEPERDIGTCPVEEEIDLDFPVVNHSSGVLHILGCTSG